MRQHVRTHFEAEAGTWPDQAAVEELEEDGEGGGSAAQQPLLSTAELQAEVTHLVQGYLGADVDPAAPLAAQGLDSLAAMELRQKLQVFTQLRSPS